MRTISRFIIAAIMLVAVMYTTGCTQQDRARKFGGTATIDVSADRKLVNVTWKDENTLWLLTRERKPGEEAERYIFEEQSRFGIVQGRVIIIED